jgi:DNA-binding NtrC family response regulator
MNNISHLFNSKKGDPSLLLVDDEPLLLNSLERLFEDDYRVFKSAEPEEAIAIARDNDIHVVVSDQRMPRMMGHQLLGAIKNVSPRTIRILLTGYADLEATVGAMDYSEVFRYISKPWKADKLFETVGLAVEVYDRIVKAEERLASGGRLAEQPILLIVGSEKEMVQKLNQVFAPDYLTLTAQTVSGAISLMQQHDVGIVLLTGFGVATQVTELEFLATVRRLNPEVVPIFLSNGRDKDLALRLINESSTFRYLAQTIPMSDLKYIVKQAAAQYQIFNTAPRKNRHRIEEEISGEQDNAPKPKTLREMLENIRERAEKKKNY